jgi:hypothetical protein
MPKCKSCGAEIKFVKMSSGKMMPVEIDETTIIFQEAGSGYLYKGNIPHWANCPGADEHRKPKIVNQKVENLTER